MRRLIVLSIFLLATSNCWALQKNVASQKWTIFAFDRTDNTSKTGDLGQITGSIWIDGVENVIDDTNPTELAHGYYEFDLAQAETNGDYLVMDTVSSTGNIQVVGCPMALWATPPYFSILSIDSNGRLDIIKVAGTTQTANDMSGDIDDILADTGTNGVVLAADAITAAKIAANAIGASEIATNAIGALELAAGCIGTSEFAAEADNIGINWNDVSNPTVSVDLQNTTFKANPEVDVTKIHGTALTETNSGDLADSFTFFFDVDPVTTKTVDDVGTAAGGGTILAVGAGNLGDYKEDAAIYFIWRTIDRSGAADTPSTVGTVAVYKNNGTGQVTTPTGITDTRSFDSGDTTAGVHLVIIDTSANSFYTVGQDYSVVLYGAVIDTKTVTSVIATFSIEKRWTEAFWEYEG